MASAHGGPTRAIGLMERALTSQGIEVETATTDEDGFGHRDGIHGWDPSTENGGVHRYFPLRLRFYKVAPGFARWIVRHVRDYDLVHVHALFSFTSAVAAMAARRAGVPYIVRPLGTLNRYGVEQRRPLLKRLSLSLIEGPILRNAAAVHFTSEVERVEAEALGIPMRSAIIPLGVEPAPSAEQPGLLERFPELGSARCILFLSRLDPKKNLEGLLRAFSLGSKYLPGTKLVIAGDGQKDYVAGLKALSEHLGLSGKVLWTGHLDGALKAEAFASAQVFVLPSFSENFGIAAAEALMAGLPCVLSSGVAIADAVSQAGAGTIVDMNPESISQALVEIMTNEKGRIAKGASAKRLATEQFSVDAMGANLVRLYSTILSKSVA